MQQNGHCRAPVASRPAFHARIIRTLAVLAAALSGAASAAEPYPGRKPIELTVLFPAGSSADVTARVLAEGMGRQLGTTIVVVNRPGGGGSIGYKHVASAAPEGHHLVWNSNSISTTHHSGALAIDYKAFDPVARAQTETPIVVVKADAPWRDLREFLAYAKGNPGKLTVGNSGSGSHTHFSSIVLFRAAGADVTDVPFGAAQVMPSLIGGHVTSVVQLPGAVTTHVKAGTLRVLAAMSAKRDPLFPDVPTASELGINAVAELWRGIAAPKGTPRAVLAKLESAVRATVENPEFARAAERFSVTPAFLPGAEFGKLIARDDAEIAAMMTTLGMRKSPQ
jgi:tripartite-type tricarboxylate transporter receptor subunit TctC